ncbi:MAG: AbrB/MazE/SpoVT family DNA-binding domain-containing protein [Faecalibacterium sp.]
MKSTGIVRGIDALGRIVLPKELRKSLGITTDTKLEIFVDGETVLMKKYRPIGACDFCGEITGDAIQYEGTCICRACQEKIKQL